MGNTNMEKAGDKLTETGRVVFVVYKDKFSIATTPSIGNEELISLLLTALEHLVDIEGEETIMH